MQSMPGRHPYQLKLSHGERAHVAMLVGVAHTYADLFHGVIHGDPHEGNILVHPDRRSISLIDFGLCTPTRFALTSPPGLMNHPAVVKFRLLRQQHHTILVMALRQMTGQPGLLPSPEALAAVRDCFRNACSHTDSREYQFVLCNTLIGLGLPMSHHVVHYTAVQKMITQYVAPYVKVSPVGPVGPDEFVAVLRYIQRYPVFRHHVGQHVEMLLCTLIGTNNISYTRVGSAKLVKNRPICM